MWKETIPKDPGHLLEEEKKQKTTMTVIDVTECEDNGGLHQLHEVARMMRKLYQYRP